MRKEDVRKIVVAAAFLLAAACGPAAAGDEAEKIDVEEIFTTVGKLDAERELVFLWWTDEVWASLAYGDKTSDAVMGYILISFLNRNYLIFSPISTAGSDLPAVSGAPVLKNDLGVSVKAVPVHESFTNMLPGMMAFPAAGEDGKPVYTKETGEIGVRVEYEGGAGPSEYKWDLPIDYPGFVRDAYIWLDQRMKTDPAQLSEEEMIFGKLGDKFRVDLGSGLMAAPMSGELFDIFLKQDPALKDDPVAMKAARAIIGDYTFFLAMTLDMEQNPDRVKALIENAVLIEAGGKNLKRDPDAEKSFADSAGKDGQYMTMVFPRTGDGGYELVLTEAETGKKISMKW